jgi:hypothetical protein
MTPGWFAAYGTRFVAGRDFDARDRQGAQPVMIVNEAFARKFFPVKSAMGGVVTFPSGTVNVRGSEQLQTGSVYMTPLVSSCSDAS